MFYIYNILIDIIITKHFKILIDITVHNYIFALNFSDAVSLLSHINSQLYLRPLQYRFLFPFTYKSSTLNLPSLSFPTHPSLF